MRRLRRIICILLALLLASAIPLSAHAAQQEEAYYIRRILGQCLEEPVSEAAIGESLTKMAQEYPRQAAVWETILADFFYVNGQMEIGLDVLPDGLPQDDSLAIVVMGLQLNDNGSMKPELLDRLNVAVRSARKYPNAYIICTGGPTSRDTDRTEAEEMALWLRICGIDESRILLEEASFSTTENAQNTLMLLYDQYPQINSLAIVTSDYHMRRSYMMFDAASLYASGYDGQQKISIVASAACTVPDAQPESLRSQVWGLAILAGVDMPA